VTDAAVLHAAHRARVDGPDTAEGSTWAADTADDLAGHVEATELMLEMRTAACDRLAGTLDGSSLRLP